MLFILYCCQILQTVFEDGLGRIVTNIPFAIFAICTTLAVTGLMAWGFYKLEVRYDPDWYIPSTRYAVAVLCLWMNNLASASVCDLVLLHLLLGLGFVGAKFNHWNKYNKRKQMDFGFCAPWLFRNCGLQKEKCHGPLVRRRFNVLCHPVRLINGNVRLKIGRR